MQLLGCRSSERGEGQTIVNHADEIADRIEREILINAPIERAWRLVSEPGWWIGDGDRSNQTVTRTGDVVIVEDPRYGRFAVLPVSADTSRYVSFRGAVDTGKVPAEHTATLVEFFLTEQDGGTLLRVVESGFTLAVPIDQRAEAVEGNIKGWEMQLDHARQVTERASA
jgi:uncharacterized protein YndB with AHSA1/START domain